MGYPVDQLHLYAYEALGWWHISVTWRTLADDMQDRDALLYRGTHVPIDEEDPEVRAVLLLDQVSRDLSAAIRGELDTLAPRPVEH